MFPIHPIHRETEAGFTDAVVQCAQMYGWLVHHDRPARTVHGWRTAIQGDPGFLDILACGYGRLVVAELKVGRNKTSNYQDAWLWRLRQVPGLEVFLWKPADWDEIESTFKRRGN